MTILEHPDKCGEREIFSMYPLYKKQRKRGWEDRKHLFKNFRWEISIFRKKVICMT